MNSAPMPQTPAEVPAPRIAAGDAERLSAWLDGELDDAASATMLNTLLRERALQQRYQGWCVVGDALRSSEVLAGHSPRLCARISQALADEPPLLAPAALRPAFKRHLASGLAVAAAAVVVVLVAVPQLRGSAPAGDGPASISSVAAPAPAAELAAAARPVRDPRLDPYLQAHRDFMGSGVMPAAAVYLRSGSEGER